MGGAAPGHPAAAHAPAVRVPVGAAAGGISSGGGADLADVQELLGHRDIRTTRRYAPVVSGKLREAVDRLALKTNKTGT